MSELMLNVFDSQRAIHARSKVGFGQALVAALSADPETIEELQTALARFVKPADHRGCFQNWSAGISEQPADAGVYLVDLAGRLVVCRSDLPVPEADGRVAFFEGDSETEFRIPYQLSEDWLFSEDTSNWQAMSAQRRQQRLKNPPLDVREVLYERLFEFIVAECLAGAPASSHQGAATAVASRRYCTASGDTVDVPEAVIEIHARWLLTPRDDLRGQPPRDLLLVNRELIESDIEGRTYQWSRLGQCPPGLDGQSAAFRFGGFGTHENILYYDLVRHLLRECWDLVVRQPDLERTTMVERIRQLRDQWLHAPQDDELDGYSPAQIIERERARLPMVSGEHSGGMVDCDCPLCQMMAEDSGPAFWFMTRCHLDDDFAFSFHRTHDEWEQEQDEWKSLEPQWEAERQRREAATPAADGPSSAQGSADDEPSVWTRSFSRPDAMAGLPPGSAIQVALFGLGAHLAELDLDLKQSPATVDMVQTLNRDFGNLRDVLGGTADLVKPVVERFCDNLRIAAESRADLAAKCADLEDQLGRFLTQVVALQRPEDDFPF